MNLFRRLCVGAPAAIGRCPDLDHGRQPSGGLRSHFLGEMDTEMVSTFADLSMTPVGLYCRVCGKTLPPAVGAGRPKAYCGALCGEIASLTQRLEAVLTARVNEIRTSELPLDAFRLAKLAALRSTLWGFANLLNAAGRPLPTATSARSRGTRRR